MSSGVVGYLSRQPSLDEFNYFNSEYFLIVGIFWGRFFSAIMKWEVLFPTAPSLSQGGSHCGPHPVRGIEWKKLGVEISFL